MCFEEGKSFWMEEEGEGRRVSYVLGQKGDGGEKGEGANNFKVGDWKIILGDGKTSNIL